MIEICWEKSNQFVLVSVNNICDAREFLCLYVIKLATVCQPLGPLAALQWARVGGWVTSGRSPPCNLTALLPISSQSSALDVRPLAQPQTAYLGLSRRKFPFIERGYCNPLQYQICIYWNDKPKRINIWRRHIQFTYSLSRSFILWSWNRAIRTACFIDQFDLGI